MDTIFQVQIFFLNEDVFLAYCEQLGFDRVKLISEGF